MCVDTTARRGRARAALRRRYDVDIAASGAAGLELLARQPPAAVSFRHAHARYDGAEFLTKACAAHPDTTRILLTGYTEMDAAIRAVNEGQVFRFFVKPCPPPSCCKPCRPLSSSNRLQLPSARS